MNGIEGRVREVAAIFFLTVVFLPAFYAALYETAETPEEKTHLKLIGDNVFDAININKWGRRMAGLIDYLWYNFIRIG